jgi:hypothetical protein
MLALYPCHPEFTSCRSALALCWRVCLLVCLLLLQQLTAVKVLEDKLASMY